MTIGWLAIGSWVLLVILAGMALLVTYKAGHEAGRDMERARWLPRIRALAAQVDDLRLQTGPPGPWLRELPQRPAGGPRFIPGPGRPQPAPRPAAVATTGIHDAVATTGGMRALTDRMIANMEAGRMPLEGPRP